MQGPAVPMGNEGLLEAITEANVYFADGRDKDFLFPKLLQHCVDLTESSFGLVCELIGPPTNPSILHIISFNSNATLNSTTSLTLELTTHITDAITTKTPCIANTLKQEDLPPNFPSIHSFIGIPLFHHEDLIGMLGLADNPAGYDLSLATFLRSFSTTCSSLV